MVAARPALFTYRGFTPLTDDARLFVQLPRARRLHRLLG